MRIPLHHPIPLSALLAGLALAGCATSGGSRPQVGTYRLSTLDGKAYDGSAPVFLRITDNSLSGKGPVNNWHGRLEGKKPVELIRSRKTGPEPLMKAENGLLRSLENGRLRKGDGNRLRVVANGQTRAVFELVSVPPGTGAR